MTKTEQVVAEVAEQLNQSLERIAAVLADADDRTTRSLSKIAEQIAAAKQLAMKQSIPTPAMSARSDESEDERIERKAAEAVQRVESTLERLGLSEEERKFCKGLGEQIVDLASDTFVTSMRRGHRYQGTCITAAIAAALIIVYDAPDEPEDNSPLISFGRI